MMILRKERNLCLAIVMCQTVGLSASITVPDLAVRGGVVGSLLVYGATYLVLGVPLLYLEMALSQFTSGDCLGVWRARPFLSHIGYILVGFQFFILLTNHIMVSFILFYLINTFKVPPPYNVCGPWADRFCGSIRTNYTVNQDCLQYNRLDYCKELYKTFPEYQYWRYKVLGVDEPGININWSVVPWSAIVCAATFLICFRGLRSLKCVVWFLVAYPVVGYCLLLVGSMLQKGIVAVFSDAADAHFEQFSKSFQLSRTIKSALTTLSIGAGITFNVAGKCSFRMPCYGNAVVTVVFCAGFAALAASCTAMMSCPYALELGAEPHGMAAARLSLLFERFPRLLHYYERPALWLALLYSANLLVGLRTSAVIFYTLQDIVAVRHTTVAHYPGFFCFVGVTMLFLSSVPFISGYSNVLVDAFHQYAGLFALFFAILETIVFVLWYGVGRLSEDIHFMQGVEPSTFMKIVWVASPVALTYAFVSEVCRLKSVREGSMGRDVGFIAWGVVVGCTLGAAAARLGAAACWGRGARAARLAPLWRPASDLLMRSRAMFSGQAITKEYIYRQYHLQAGISARQKLSNVRNDSQSNRESLS